MNPDSRSTQQTSNPINWKTSASARTKETTAETPTLSLTQQTRSQQAEADPVETASPSIQPTRRQQQQPQPQQHPDTFKTVDDLKLALRQDIAHATRGPEPVQLSRTFVLLADALLPINFPPEQHRRPRNGEVPLSSPAWTVCDLCKLTEPKDRRVWQRGAARGLLMAVQEVDGFKYTVNNNWSSKDDAGLRFSYTCLDSKENKDRQANCDRRQSGNPDDVDVSMNDATSTSIDGASTTNPQETRGIRKETFDCKGQVAVKFSGARRVVELVYRHTALHKSAKDQSPSSAKIRKINPPGKRRLAESDDRQDSMPTDVASIHDSAAAVPMDDDACIVDDTVPDTKRRKHADGIFAVPSLQDLQHFPMTFHPDDNISLVELLRASESQEAAHAHFPVLPVKPSQQQPQQQQQNRAQPQPQPQSQPQSQQLHQQQQHQPAVKHTETNLPPANLPPLHPLATAPTRPPSTHSYNNNLGYPQIAGAPNTNGFAQAPLPMYMQPQYQAHNQRTLNDFVYPPGPHNAYSQAQSPRSDIVHQMQNRQGVAQRPSMNLVNPVTWFQSR